MNASRVKMFEGLSNIELARVLGRLEKITRPAGTLLFAQGDVGEDMYILQEGTIDLLAHAASGEQRPLARLLAGDSLGEMALLTGEQRSATAVIGTDAVLYRMDRPTFDELILEQPSISAYFLKQLSARLNQSNMQLQASKEEQAQRARQELQEQSPAIRELLLKLSVFPVIEASLPLRLLDAGAGEDAAGDQAGDQAQIGHGTGAAKQATAELSSGQEGGGADELALLGRYLQQPVDRPGWLMLDPALRRMLGELFLSEQPAARRRELLAEEAGRLAAAGHPDEAMLCWLELQAWPEATAMLRALVERGASLPARSLERLDGCPAGLLAGSGLLLNAYAQQGIAEEREPVLDQLEAMIALEPPGWTSEQQARVYEWAAELSHRLGRHAKALEYVQMAEALGRPRGERGLGAADSGIGEQNYRLKKQQVQRQRTERLADRAGRLLQRTRWSAAASVLSAILVILLFVWLPPVGGLSEQAMVFIGISIAAVILWIVNIIPDYLVALLMAMLWVLGGVVSPETALSGFATPTWLYMVFILALGAAITRSGILYRLSLHALKRFPSHYRGQLWGIVAGGALLNPLIPSSSAKVALGVPVAKTLSESMGFRDRSKGAAGLGLAAMVFYGFTAPFVLTGSYTNVMAYGLAGANHPISWFAWFLYALPAFLLFSAGILLLLRVLFRGVQAEKPISRQMLDEQLAVLGAFTRAERITTLTVIGCILLMIAQPLHGVDNAWVMLLGFGVLITTGVLDTASLKSGVDWPFLIFIGIAFSFAAAASELGIVEAMTGFLGEHMTVFLASPALFLLAVVGLSFLVTLIIRDDPAVILLVIALLPLAELAGVHPWVLVFLILLSTDPFFFAYQSPTYLMAYYSTEGKAFSHRQGQWMGLGYGVMVLLIALICIPYWQWLGLIQ